MTMPGGDVPAFRNEHPNSSNFGPKQYKNLKSNLTHCLIKIKYSLLKHPSVRQGKSVFSKAVLHNLPLYFLFCCLSFYLFCPNQS